METCIYGPVPSRRLGRSLGIDLLPAKICTYDCIYCQLGRTAGRTIKRRPYRKAEDILFQLKNRLAEGVQADCITIAGSGEPTLNNEIGTVIEGIKKASPLPLAVLTNGSLLSDSHIRQSLMSADIVVPSLDAHSPELFKTVNRPHKAIAFDRMLEGLVAFSRVFPGRLWLEIFIMDGINASPDDADRFKPLVDMITPDDIYVNTAVRPPLEGFVKEAGEEAIDLFYRVLGLRRQRDTVFSTGESDRTGNLGSAILEMAARRPVTIDDMAAGLASPVDMIRRQVKDLLAAKRLDKVDKKDSAYFRTRTPDEEP